MGCRITLIDCRDLLRNMKAWVLKIRNFALHRSCGPGSVCLSLSASNGILAIFLAQQGVYIQVARACEQLIAQAGSSRREIRAEGVSGLPTVLGDLKPSYVIVDTNYVMLRIGGGQMSHSIVWGCVKSDRHVWRLRLAGPDHERSIVLYQETKTGE